MIKLGYTILYVADVEKALSFYETTFGFVRKFSTPENDYGELNTGETSLAFASIGLAQSNLKESYRQSTLQEKPFGIELGIVTDQVAVLVEKACQNGAVLVVAPVQKPWGQTVAYIRDIDGFLVEICTPVSA
jgi:lactoylglutathione lyase